MDAMQRCYKQAHLAYFSQSQARNLPELVDFTTGPGVVLAPEIQQGAHQVLELTMGCQVPILQLGMLEQ